MNYADDVTNSYASLMVGAAFEQTDLFAGLDGLTKEEYYVSAMERATSEEEALACDYCAHLETKEQGADS